MKFLKIKVNINLFTKREKLLLFILFLVLLEIFIYLILENEFLKHKNNMEVINKFSNNLSEKEIKKDLKFLKVEEKNFLTFKNENPNLKIQKINQNTILTKISVLNNDFKNLENILNYYKIKKMNFNLDNENLDGEAHISFKDIPQLNDDLKFNYQNENNLNNLDTYKEPKNINKSNDKDKVNQVSNKSKKIKELSKSDKNQIINANNIQKKEKINIDKKEDENYTDIKLMFSLDFIEENFKNENSNIKYFISEDFHSIGIHYNKTENDDLNILYIPIEKKHYKKLKFQFRSLNKFKGKVGILKDNQIYYQKDISNLEFNDINANYIFIVLPKLKEENLIFIDEIKGII